MVVTGKVTGGATSLDDLWVARRALGLYPLIVGSGLSPGNAREQLVIADGAIVGTALKTRGVRPDSHIDRRRCEKLMTVVEEIRRGSRAP